MPSYTVTIYTIYGLSVDVDAPTPQKAVVQALEETDFEQPHDLDLFWASETTEYVVTGLRRGLPVEVFHARDAAHVTYEISGAARQIYCFDPELN